MVPFGLTTIVEPEIEGPEIIVGLLNVQVAPFIQTSLEVTLVVSGLPAMVVSKSGFAIGALLLVGGLTTVICKGTSKHNVDGLGSQTGIKKLYSPGVVQVNVNVPLLATTGEHDDGLFVLTGGLL